MMADAMRLDRSDDPAGVRLRSALAMSLVLHALALVPWQRFGRTAPPPRPAPVLSATLLAPALKTFEEQDEPQPVAAVEPPRESVAPASTSGISALPPRQLKGQALDRALAALAREEFYPREAIARGLEGRVVLLLTLAENGAVAGIEVASGSGHRLLDDAARQAAQRIGRIPGGRHQVLLPVEFRLE